MAADTERFARLPRQIKVEETVATVDTRAVADPESGHDTDRDFVLRFALL